MLQIHVTRARFSPFCYDSGEILWAVKETKTLTVLYQHMEGGHLVLQLPLIVGPVEDKKNGVFDNNEDGGMYL